MPAYVLLRESIHYTVDPAGVNMVKARCCLKDVLGEEIVLAIDNLVMLQVEDFLWEVLAFTIAVKDERRQIE